MALKMRKLEPFKGNLTVAKTNGTGGNIFDYKNNPLQVAQAPRGLNANTPLHVAQAPQELNANTRISLYSPPQVQNSNVFRAPVFGVNDKPKNFLDYAGNVGAGLGNGIANTIALSPDLLRLQLAWLNDEQFGNTQDAAAQLGETWKNSLPGLATDSVANAGMALGDMGAGAVAGIQNRPDLVKAAEEQQREHLLKVGGLGDILRLYGTSAATAKSESILRKDKKAGAKALDESSKIMAKFGMDTTDEAGVQSTLINSAIGAAASPLALQTPLLADAARGLKVGLKSATKAPTPATKIPVKDIDTSSERVVKVKTPKLAERMKQIRKELNDLPSEASLQKIKLEAKRTYAERIKKAKNIGREDAIPHYKAAYDKHVKGSQDTLAYRAKLAAEADAIKVNPLYVEKHPISAKVVTGKARDTTLVDNGNKTAPQVAKTPKPKVTARTLTEKKPVKENPYSKSGTGRPLTDDTNLLRIKASKAKDATRKAELEAELAAKTGTKKAGSNDDAYAVLARDAKKSAERYKGSWGKNLIADLKRKLIDPTSEFAKSDRKAAKKAGVKFKDSKAGTSLAKLQNDVKNAEGMLTKQVKNHKLPNGNTLQQTIRKYPKGEQMEKFIMYVAHKSDLENRGIKGGTKINPQLTDAQVAKAVQDFESAHPSAVTDAQTIKQFKDLMEREGASVGTITKADAEQTIASREFYFPTKRVDVDNLVRPNVKGGLHGTQADQKLIKSRSEGGAPADYSWDAVLGRFVNDKVQNLETRKFREMHARADTDTLGAHKVSLKSTGDGELGFDSTSGVGRNIYRGLIKGEKKALELDRDLAMQFKDLSPLDGKDAISKINNTFVAGMKVVFTGMLNPIFSAVNLVVTKNPLILIHNQGVGAIGIRPILSAIPAVLNLGKFSERGLTAYGANVVKATQNVANKRISAEMLGLSVKNPIGLAKFTLEHPWTSLKAVGRAFDHALAAGDRPLRSAAARQAYIRAKRQKLTEHQALEKAAEVYNESMGNFNRVTNAARAAEPLLLYSGAIQAGARPFVRAYRDRPIQTLAVDIAFVSGTGLLIKSNLDNTEKGKEFYQDMQDSNKEYILDGNVILVTPFAERNEKTGEWTGVMKLPIAPDYRPLNRAVWKTILGKTPSAEDIVGHFTGDLPRSIRELPKTNIIANTASVIFNRDPRTNEQIVSNYEKATKPRSEQVDEGYTSDAARNISKVVPISPKQADALFNGLGLTGDILQNKAGNPLLTIKESWLKQFGKGLSGTSSGGSFYKDLESVSKGMKNEADFTAFALLHTKNEDKTIDNPAARAKILLAQPEVLKAENRLNELAIARGDIGNPFYALDANQQEKVLRYRASKDLNAAKQSYSKDGQSLYVALGFDGKWYQDFRDKETVFYQDLTKKQLKEAKAEEKPDKEKIQKLEKKVAAGEAGTFDATDSAASTYSGRARVNDPAGEKLQDQYNALPEGDGPKGGNASRTKFIEAHPELLEYWANQDDFSNAERLALGMTLLEDKDSSGSGSYSKYSKSGGGSSGKKAKVIGKYDNVIARGGVAYNVKQASLGSKSPTMLKSVKKATGKKPKVTLKKATA